jgi:copper oxidase (laccase) domain-containing protein
MGVTVADCVPVFLVVPGKRAAILLHAGWRGAAKGILEEGVKALGDPFDSNPEDAFLHLGPAICGSCYEVGPEVHAALGLQVPGAPTPVDLRGVLAGRAVALGIPAERITRSAFCTRCGDSPFFSHRNGHSQRQVAFLGVRLP